MNLTSIEAIFISTFHSIWLDFREISQKWSYWRWIQLPGQEWGQSKVSEGMFCDVRIAIVHCLIFPLSGCYFLPCFSRSITIASLALAIESARFLRQ